MNRAPSHIRAWVFMLLIAASVPSFAQPISDFSTDAESWTTVGKCPAESAPGTPTWSATGGNPGGHISATDETVGTFYWIGSGAEWKGNLSAYYGCYLLFDLKTNTDIWPTDEYDVLIVATDDSTLSYNTASDPGTSWTSYVVPLFEGGWIVDGPLDADDCPNLSGTAATAADMLNYLSVVKRFRIRAEYSGLSYETNYLDNVYIDCGLFLPVELVDFTAESEAFGVARLNWTTSSEINCKEFEIQKSTDGVAFKAIGTVEGNGTSTETNSYVFYDDNFLMSAYYRLKQIDFNGEFEYSNIIPLSSAVQYEATTRIYPNPATDQLYVAGSFPIIGVKITNLSGAVVYDEPIQFDSFLFNRVLQVGDLAPGIYIITIFGETTTQQQILEVLN